MSARRKRSAKRPRVKMRRNRHPWDDFCAMMAGCAPICLRCALDLPRVPGGMARAIEMVRESYDGARRWRALSAPEKGAVVNEIKQAQARAAEQWRPIQITMSEQDKAFADGVRALQERVKDEIMRAVVARQSVDGLCSALDDRMTLGAAVAQTFAARAHTIAVAEAQRAFFLGQDAQGPDGPDPLATPLGTDFQGLRALPDGGFEKKGEASDGGSGAIES